MNFWVRRYNLKSADRIVVPKSELSIVQHHVIYLGQDSNGVDLIIENKIGFGVRLVTVDDFFKSVIEITRIERFKGTSQQRKLAVRRALNKLGAPYNLINYNCESFASEVQTGIVKSQQVENTLGGAAMLAGVALVFNLLRSSR